MEQTTPAALEPPQDIRPRPGRAGTVFGRGIRLTKNAHILSLADQISVSGANFLTLVLLGAWADLAELGTYAIAASVIVLSLATQDSLVTRPFVIQMHRQNGSPVEHASMALMLSLLLSAAFALGLGATAVLMMLTGIFREWAAIALVMAGAIPFMLLREFGRRFAFAHFEMVHALLLDLAVVAASMTLLIWLGWNGHLSATTAVAVMGVSCALGAAGWLSFARNRFEFRGVRVSQALRQTWALSKWLFTSQIAKQAQGYSVHWITMAVAGAASTGIFAACVSVVSLMNPLLIGFFNIMIPKSARTFNAGGGRGLRREAVRDALLLAGVMSVFCVSLAFFGEEVVHFLFPDTRSAETGGILLVLGLGVLAQAAGAPASTALASAHRVQAVAAISLAALVINIVLVWSFMAYWGLVGAVWAALIAETVACASRWTAFLVLVPEPAASGAAEPQNPAPGSAR